MKFFVLILLTLFSFSLQAKMSESFDNYHVKKDVEKILVEEVESILKTKLAEGSFSVNLKVKLAPPKPRNLASVSNEEVDLRLKLFDLQKIIEAYKNQDRDPEKAGIPEIESVDIMVGISEFYSPNFRNQFKPWFTTLAKKRIGDASVSYTLIGEPQRPDPEKDKKPEDDKDDEEDLERIKEELRALERKFQEEMADLNRGVIEKIADVKDDLKDELSDLARDPASLEPKSWFDHLKDLQGLLGWLLFGCLLLWAVRHLAKHFSPNLTSTNEIISKEEKSGEVAEEPAEGDIEELSDLADMEDGMDDKNALSPLEDMVLALAIDQSKNIRPLFDYWMQGNTTDHRKFWSLMSLCLNKNDLHGPTSSIVGQMRDFIRERNIEWSEKAFSFTREQKSEELASALFNDFVRLKTFGPESFRPKLAGLRGLSVAKLKAMISDIGQEEILFLFLAEDQKKSYLDNLPESHKVALLESSMKLMEVSDYKISVIEQRVDQWISENAESYKDKVISLSEKIGETFKALNFKQKSQFVLQILAKGEESFESLCKSHFHALWFHKLKETVATDLVSLLDYNEVVYIYGMSDAARDRILGCAAPRLRSMLYEEDLSDLQQKLLAADSRYQGYDEAISKKLESYLVQKGLDLHTAYDFSDDSSGKAAA